MSTAHICRRYFCVFLCCTAVVVFALGPVTEADVFRWIDPNQDDFDDPGNWLVVPPDTGNPPPRSGDTARFTGTGSTVIFDGDEASDALEVEAGSLFFQSSGGDWTYDVITGGADVSLTGGSLTLSNLDLNIGDSLLAHGDAALLVTAGSNVTAQRLSVGPSSFSGTGGISVSGSGSSLDITGASANSIGSNGEAGNILIFQNVATGSLAGTTSLATQNAASGTTGIMRVSTGATVMTDSLALGGINTGVTGTIEVGGASGQASSLTMNGVSTLTVGAAGTSPGGGLVDIGSFGTLTTGTGDITVNENGLIDVESQGEFNVNGHLTVDGGTMRVGRPGPDFDLDTSLILTAQNGALIDFNNSYTIDNITTFKINSGSTYEQSGFLNVGSGTLSGELIVDGSTSSFSASLGVNVGINNGDGSVTIREGASATIPKLGVAVSTFGTDGNGFFNVESGASVMTSDDVVINQIGFDGSGSITVGSTGATSMFTMSAGELIVGHDSTGTATLTVEDGGVFTTSTDNITVNDTGFIEIEVGGVFNANGSVLLDGGRVRDLNTLPGFNLGAGQILTAQNGSLVDVESYRFGSGTTWNFNDGARLDASALSVGDNTSGTDGTLTVDGSTSRLDLNINLQLGGDGGSGMVTIRNGATASVGGPFHVVTDTAGGGNSSGIFNVESGASVDVGSVVRINSAGSTGSGVLNVGSTAPTDSTFTMNDSGILTVGASAGQGTLTVMDGGVFTSSAGMITINSTGLIDVQSNGVFNANGDIIVDGGTLRTDSLAEFNLAASKTVTARNSGSLDLFSVVIADNSIWTIEGFSSTLDMTNGGELIIGHADTGTGTLVIRNAGKLITSSNHTTVKATGSIENQLGGRLEVNGDLTLDGGSLTNDGTATIDLAAGNSLVVQNGGSIIYNGSSFTLNSNSEFQVSSSSAVEFTGSMNVGFGTTNAILSVDNSVFDAGTLRVGTGSGGGSSGMATFANGSCSELGDITIGIGSVNVQSDSHVLVFGDVEVNSFSSAGDAMLTVGSNAAISTFTVNNGSGELLVGHATTGTGTVDINAGGLMDAKSNGVSIRATGQLNINGGSFISSGDTTVDGGSITLSSGEMSAGGIELANGGQFNFFGGKLHIDSFTGDLNNVSGTLAPGTSAGRTLVVGDYIQQQGTLEIEIGGLVPTSEHDQLAAIGDINLGGALDVSLINGFIPEYNDSFLIVKTLIGGLAGTFNVVNGVLINDDLTLAPIYSASELNLVGSLPGDGNTDGIVNFVDFVLLSNNFNDTNTQWVEGNFNLDFTTNFADFVILSNHFNRGVSSDNTVPEPAMVILAMVGAVFLGRFKVSGKEGIRGSKERVASYEIDDEHR